MTQFKYVVKELDGRYYPIRMQYDDRNPSDLIALRIMSDSMINGVQYRPIEEYQCGGYSTLEKAMDLIQAERKRLSDIEYLYSGEPVYTHSNKEKCQCPCLK